MWSLDEALGRFRELRDDCSEEIPETILHSYTLGFDEPPDTNVGECGSKQFVVL